MANDGHEGMDKTAGNPYPPDLEDLRKSLKKPYNRSVVRRSINVSHKRLEIIAGWARQAADAGYPAFLMGAQFVVYFKTDGSVVRLSGDVVDKIDWIKEKTKGVKDEGGEE